MKNKIKTVLIVVVGILAIVYAGYRMNLYPTSVVEDSKEQLVESGEEIDEMVKQETGESTEEIGETAEEETGTSTKSVLRQVLEHLDTGMESKASKKEEEEMDVSDFERSLEWFYVDYVIDGDTIVVFNDNHPGGVKARYIGIDTPESVHDDASKNTAEGKIAAERNAEIIEEVRNDICFQFDEEETDEYGRLLVYAYIYNDETEEYRMIQDILLEEGMCQTMTIEPNTKYSEHFKELEAKARENKVGFWGTGFYK